MRARVRAHRPGAIAGPRGSAASPRPSRRRCRPLRRAGVVDQHDRSPSRGRARRHDRSAGGEVVEELHGRDRVPVGMGRRRDREDGRAAELGAELRVWRLADLDPRLAGHRRPQGLEIGAALVAGRGKPEVQSRVGDALANRDERRRSAPRSRGGARRPRRTRSPGPPARAPGGRSGVAAVRGDDGRGRDRGPSAPRTARTAPREGGTPPGSRAAWRGSTSASVRRRLDPQGVVLEQRVVVDVDDGGVARGDGRRRPACRRAAPSTRPAAAGRQTCQRGPRSSRIAAESGSTRRSSRTRPPVAPRARRRGSGGGGRRPSGVGRPRAGSARAGSRGKGWIRHPADYRPSAVGRQPARAREVAAGASRARRRRAPERARPLAPVSEERSRQRSHRPSMRRPAKCYAPARMATTAEARPLRAARRPGAIELVTSGFREIWSHRRLTRYLVRADLKKHGSDTVLGNIWWVLDPLLQMVVYVVLVSVIFHDQDRRLPAVRLRGDPAVEVVLVGGERRDLVGHVARADHQAGQVPQDRPAGRRRRRAASSASRSG